MVRHAIPAADGQCRSDGGSAADPTQESLLSVILASFGER